MIPATENSHGLRDIKYRAHHYFRDPVSIIYPWVMLDIISLRDPITIVNSFVVLLVGIIAARIVREISGEEEEVKNKK